MQHIVVLLKCNQGNTRLQRCIQKESKGSCVQVAYESPSNIKESPIYKAFFFCIKMNKLHLFALDSKPF